MNKNALIILFVLAATIGFAHSEKTEPLAQFFGESTVKTPPDIISLAITVHSECQESPKDAQEATDKVTKQISDYLESDGIKRATDEHFKILVDGGYTMPFSRWYRPKQQQQQMQQYVPDREVCRNTFQKVTAITLKVGASKDFHQSFNDIQDYVLKTFSQNPSVDDVETPRTYVSVSTPNPDITPEHRAVLEREALDKAVRNAKANFKAATASCTPHQWKIRSIRENGSDVTPRPPRHYAAAVRDVAAKDAAPVRFDDIEVSKSVMVSFEFDGATCYEN